VYTAEGARFDDAGEDLQRLTGQIERQIFEAVERADLVLFVLDAQSGITALDETIANLLRKTAAVTDRDVPIRVVANKVDAMSWEPHAYEFSALGFGEPILLGAKNNYKRREFLDTLFNITPEADPSAKGAEEMRLALIGRRNAGKSTFITALAGEERVITSEIAGTTRDAIDVRFEMDGRACVAIDTAGVRKRGKFADRVEHWAFDRCQQAVRRADVALLIIDATQNVTAIDKRLGAFVAQEFKPCIIVVNKWDLAEGRKNRKGQPISTRDYQTYIEKELTGLSMCPIVFTSAIEGRNIKAIIDVAHELHEQASVRMPTGQLNRTMKEIIEQRGPSSRLGTQAKVYYATQVTTNPPTIVLQVNKPELFGDQYQRFLLNRLRELTPFEEVPIRLFFRARKREDLKEMMHKGRVRAASSGERAVMETESGETIELTENPGDEQGS
jgi:GTP-binding protein